MRKAEIETHHDAYVALETKIRGMLGQRQFPGALSACVESLAHVVPAIKYRKQWGDGQEVTDLLPLSVIWKYAPPLFEHGALETVLDFVRSQRALGPNRVVFLEASAAAVEREEMARLLWKHLSDWPESAERGVHELLGIDESSAADIIAVWVELGLVARSQADDGSVIHFVSRLANEVEGMCPACGAVGRGRREALYKATACRRCGAQGYYFIKYPDLVN